MSESPHPPLVEPSSRFGEFHLPSELSGYGRSAKGLAVVDGDCRAYAEQLSGAGLPFVHFDPYPHEGRVGLLVADPECFWKDPFRYNNVSNLGVILVSNWTEWNIKQIRGVEGVILGAFTYDDDPFEIGCAFDEFLHGNIGWEQMISDSAVQRFSELNALAVPNNGAGFGIELPEVG